jgi:hypothetical protein
MWDSTTCSKLMPCGSAVQYSSSCVLSCYMLLLLFGCWPLPAPWEPVQHKATAALWAVQGLSNQTNHDLIRYQCSGIHRLLRLCSGSECREAHRGRRAMGLCCNKN